MAHHKNWIEIYHFFLNNPGASYTDISKAFGVPVGTIKYQAAKTYWQEKRQEVIANAIKQIETETKIKITESKRQQAEFGKVLQNRAAKILATGQIEPKTASEIAQWIRTGVDIERRALEMDKSYHRSEITEQTTEKQLLENETRSDEDE